MPLLVWRTLEQTAIGARPPVEARAHERKQSARDVEEHDAYANLSESDVFMVSDVFLMVFDGFCLMVSDGSLMVSNCFLMISNGF